MIKLEITTNEDATYDRMTEMVESNGRTVKAATGICYGEHKGWMSHDTDTSYTFKNIGGAKRSVRSWWTDDVNDYVAVYMVGADKRVTVNVAAMNPENGA